MHGVKVTGVRPRERCYPILRYIFPAIIYRDIISHIISTYRDIMYFFRTFKKSTAPYKVHNMGLRYIKNLLLAFSQSEHSLVSQLRISADSSKRWHPNADCGVPSTDQPDLWCCVRLICRGHPINHPSLTIQRIKMTYSVTSTILFSWGIFNST